MGLNHPTDLDAWQAWQDRRHPARKLKRAALGRLRGEPVPRIHVTRGREFPKVAVVVESRSMTTVLALLEPVRHLVADDVLVMSADPVLDLLPQGGRWEVVETSLDEFVLPPSVEVVVAAGHYLQIGRRIYAQAAERGLPFVVVQHGLHTPLAPPLPPGAHLLSWSQEDADFWVSGRSDITGEVVGSQLLWRVVNGPRVEPDPAARPVFLGQLHGAELSRRDMARVIRAFCLETGARYRPHPSESDRLSRWQHARWEKAGIEIDRSGIPLAELTSPVVSIFSTGVLEAAARGVPAWVTYDDPPLWLVDFWTRYGMSRWGDDPPPTPDVPTEEPARVVAERIREMLQ